MSLAKYHRKSMERLARSMKQHARLGCWDGRAATTNLPYFVHAKQLHRPTGSLMIYTREEGYHSSGWWKNPDYERCYHLSLSFWDLENEIPRPFEEKLAVVWTEIFFGEWTRYIWEEREHYKNPAEVRHYRVFCNEAWQPIIPRGEVYNKELTEAGWLSWSDRVYEESKKREDS